jgi:hypothetical protein
MFLFTHNNEGFFVTEHSKVVRSSFAIIKPRMAEVVDLLYGKLFELEPEMRFLFPGDMTE